MDRHPTAPSFRSPARRTLYLLSAAALWLTTLLVVGAWAAVEAKAPRGKCRSPTGRILAEGPLVVAYTVGRPSRVEAPPPLSGRLVGCLRSTGAKRVLSASAYGDYWFDRPARAVAVHGSAVGYVTQQAPTVEFESDKTVISIESLSRSSLRRPSRVFLRRIALGNYSSFQPGLEFPRSGGHGLIRRPGPSVSL